MKVSELVENLDNKETTPVSTLGQVELREDGLVVPNHSDVILFDETAQKQVGKFLKIPPKYLTSVPRDLQMANVNYWLQKNSEVEAMFHIRDNFLVDVHDADKKFVPMTSLIETVAKAFDAEDEVQSIHSDTEKLHLDIISQASEIVVPGLGTTNRPANDITKAGIRLRANSDWELQKPTLESYLLRLVCTNGLTIQEPEYQVRLRGNTVPEILQSMEENAQKLLSNLPERLEAYRNSAEVPVPGNLELFVYNVGRERGLGTRIMDRVMQEIATLPSGPSVYDVMNVFTFVATQDVSYANRLRLEGLGGELVTETETILHRCDTCERPLS